MEIKEISQLVLQRLHTMSGISDFSLTYPDLPQPEKDFAVLRGGQIRLESAPLIATEEPGLAYVYEISIVVTGGWYLVSEEMQAIAQDIQRGLKLKNCSYDKLILRPKSNLQAFGPSYDSNPADDESTGLLTFKLEAVVRDA